MQSLTLKKIKEKAKRHYEKPEAKEKKKILEQNRRAKKVSNGGRFTKTEWELVKNKYQNRCLRCGRDNVKLTIDHVVPISLGGKHEIDNIQPLCLSCNSRKRTKTTDYRPETVRLELD